MVNPVVGRGKRVLSTATGPELPSWPTASSPSPYEIFGISPAKFDKQMVQERYYRMAKVYHPDGAGHDSMGLEIRQDRFKKLVEAYSILRDDTKRRAYDTSSASALNRRSRQMYRTTSTASTYSDPFYGRGFYEGYEEDADRRRSDADFQQRLKENRGKMVILVCIGVGLVATLQLTAIFRLAEKNRVRAEHATFLAEMQTMRAVHNYDLGNGAEDRISRFLAVRNASGYYDNHDVKRNAAIREDTTADGSSSVIPPVAPSPLDAAPLDAAPVIELSTGA